MYSSGINIKCFSEFLQTLDKLFSFCPESNGLGKAVIYSVQLHWNHYSEAFTHLHY